MNNWRLIPLLNATGRVQMAIDLWLLQQHQQGSHPSTLRFYTWTPAAISLGYHQRRWPEFWPNLTWQDQPIELIRRPSGGRAVLHQGDLTYAVITSGLIGRRTQVYQTLCQFLIAGWQSLGVELHYGDAGRGYIHNPNCFGTATGADLVSSENAKLIGSAQLCRGNAILQHGSMRLHQDDTLFAQVFNTTAPPKVNIPVLQGEKALIPSVIDALTTAAENCFQAQMVIQPLSEAEWQAILAQPIPDIAFPSTISSLQPQVLPIF